MKREGLVWAGVLDSAHSEGGVCATHYWTQRITKGVAWVDVVERQPSKILFKKGLECGMFGSFLALCRSGLGCGRATGSLTWENKRRERKCDLMLRNYATFEGAFAHAYTSHGRIQGLLAKMVASGTMRAWAKSVHA